jgi:TPR repeat protein/tRNA A-37 threonylcarbamoyl transferase component Bud32
MTSPDLLAPGAVFAGDYTIVRPLSEGGMGALYVVQQVSTGAQRALKLMHAQLVRDPRLRQRFEQEARVGSRIESEHVVQVLGAGIDEASGMPWLVMELLNGQDLSRAIELRGALPPAEVRDIFAQFTHAIAAAHRVGIVHRDLKPENIFLAVSHREGMAQFVKVLDFGIAKVVAEAKATATQALGTPTWMAPEQTEPGRSIAPAADVWALGLIAFRMFTGKHFWISANSEDATPTMVLREAVIDSIVSASARAQEYGRAHLLPAGFDAWFARCVVRQPEARFVDAGVARDAFAEMLDRGAFSAPAQATIAGAPAGFTPAGTPPAGPTPAPIAAVAAVIAAAQSGPVTQPGAPFVAGAPPARSARRGRSSAPLWGAAIGVLAIAGVGGLGIRAVLQSQKVKDCESGKGDDLLAACRVACSTQPKKFCVTHGDLARGKDDVDEAARSYGKGCDAGDGLGCRKLGSLQEIGQRGAIEKNEALALENYTKGCDARSASGCAWLARRLERGRGIPRDAARATSLLESACAEDPGSCVFLGWSAENRPMARPAPAEIAALHAKAAPALREECASGGLAECAALGTLLQSGKGVERDVAAAASFFHKACEGGAPEGCNNEAALQVMNADAGKAIESFRKLCTAGTPAACNNLALLQASVPLSLRQEQGASLFKPICTDTLSLGCTQGSPVIRPPAGINKDIAGAATLLQKACADGLGVACANLGAFQESGFGVARDAAQAMASYEKACAAGAPDGCVAARENPFRPGEAWSGSYTCGQGSTDLVLRILDQAPDQKVTAIFDFDYGHGQVPGRFLVSGTYDAARGAIAFSPGIWLEAPAGWMTVGLSGQVSLQKTIFTGKIDAPRCGNFRVVRMVSDMVPTECAAGARFVEGHGCVPVPRPGPTAIGVWTGKGTETSGSSWLITATLKSLETGRCGQVSYPTLGCGGDWYCVKSSDGKKLRAREIITSGQGRCDSTGFIDMTVSDDGQAAEWRWSSPGRGGTSSAHLARAAAPP